MFLFIEYSEGKCYNKSGPASSDIDLMALVWLDHDEAWSVYSSEILEKNYNYRTNSRNQACCTYLHRLKICFHTVPTT